MKFNAQEIFQAVPQEFLYFLLVSFFSLIIGLSQRRLHGPEQQMLFGTDRTFTFIGIFGYILLLADPVYKRLFMAGGFALIAFLLVYYFFKIKQFQDFGLTTIFVALLTYCIPLILVTQPFWLFLLVLVTLIVFTELKSTFTSFSEKFDKNEFLTLAKFIVMAGLVLPILPNEPFITGLDVTPYKVWLAVVIISSISYISYLLKKFVFKDAGIVLSGILGGLYSSTATTVVLARKLKSEDEGRFQYLAAIILATAMMYLRILILLSFFNKTLFTHMLPAFFIMIVVSVAAPLFVLYKNRKSAVKGALELDDKNPLEFKIALVFTIIFITFSVLTQYAIQQFGTTGLSVLSFIVGIIDIDPFLINIFQGKYEVSLHLLSAATFQAIISNNIAKTVYACSFGGKKNMLYLISLFGIIIVLNTALIFIF